MSNYIVKQAALEDVRLMFEWARIEGWDWELMIPFLFT